MAKSSKKVPRNGAYTIKVQAGHGAAPTYSWGKGYVVRAADTTGQSNSKVEVTSDMLARAFDRD
jgi:hypothetical protein